MSYIRALITQRPSDWLQHLEDHYKIKVVRDEGLVSLKYNQIESPMHEPIVQECRGMVIQEATGRILAHSYNKFWNHGESLADEIDWHTARVLEKLDGSLMQLWWDSDAEMWRVSSSGHPTAGGSFGSDARTFAVAFWDNFKALDMRLPYRLVDQACTFMFELCDTPNRIVVRHDKPRIVLHGARDVQTGSELNHEQLRGVATSLNWELVKSYPIGSIADCLTAAEALDPVQTEGFVVVDANFHRVKIKSPRYVALHHLKGEFSPRRAVELWQTGEASELLTHFPEMEPQIVPVHEKLNSFAAKALAAAENASSRSTDRKSYAVLVKDEPWSSVCFKLLSHQTPWTVEQAQEILRSQSLASLERLLEQVA
jgi:hypothetical protein